MKKTTHYLNLWDDFAEVGMSSEHSIPGETHVQVESEGITTTEEQKEILNHFLPFFANFFEARGVTVELFLYDTKLKYPHMSDELHSHIGWKHYSVWQLKLTNMTYKLSEEFMEYQESHNHKYKGTEVRIISES